MVSRQFYNLRSSRVLREMKPYFLICTKNKPILKDKANGLESLVDPNINIMSIRLDLTSLIRHVATG